jgi:hypothetical protein
MNQEVRNEILARENTAGKIVGRYAPDGAPISTRTLADAIAGDLGVKNVKFNQGNIGDNRMGYYGPIGRVMNVTDNPEFQGAVPSTLMHELMHAKDAASDPFFFYKDVDAQEGDPGVEHIKGVKGKSVSKEYIPELLDYMNNEEKGLWFNSPKRDEMLAMYPWLANVKAASSNRLPTPWDLKQNRDPLWELVHEK